MSQQDSLNMKVVVLAVICVILLASTIGAFVLYIPAQTQIDEKNQTITSLNQQISDLQAQLNAVPDNSDLQSQIDSLKNTNLNLQDQWNQMNATMYEYVEAYNNQQKYIDLKAYGTLYNNGTTLDANSTITLWTGTINYAGYVLIDATSNTTSTYAQATCVFGDYTISYNQTLGTDNTVVFAVLPGTLTVAIGNINQKTNFNATATYYY
jgi:hypothetical protein